MCDGNKTESTNLRVNFWSGKTCGKDQLLQSQHAFFTAYTNSRDNSKLFL